MAMWPIIGWHELEIIWPFQEIGAAAAPPAMPAAPAAPGPGAPAGPVTPPSNPPGEDADLMAPTPWLFPEDPTEALHIYL